MAKNVDDYLECRFDQGEHLDREDIAFLLNFAPDARNGVCQALAQQVAKLAAKPPPNRVRGKWRSRR